MDDSALRLVSEIGTQLAQQTRPNKDFIVKSLRQAVSALSQFEQPSSSAAAKKAEAAKHIETAINPLKKRILNGFLHHRDKDIRLLVAICISEIFRILAPEPPFEDRHLRDVFKLFLSIFAELSDTASPFFSRRVKILETISRCKCCVIMLDIDCNDLVMEMFNIFFSVVREHHQRSLVNDMLSIMSNILNEEASQPIVDVILRNLLKEGKETPSASSQLAISLIQTCAEKLEHFVCGFLTSCILDRDATRSELTEFYHEIIYKIFQCAPQMLLAVIPNLTQELLTDQVDTRIKALTLIGKLLSLPEQRIAQNYRNLFVEFLKRFSDKSAEVRASALQCAKVCYMTNPTGPESHEVLSALEGRLLDFDDKVRSQAVIVACDIARTNLKIFPPKLLSQTTERLRDKKISVRKETLKKLLEVYHEYCKQCAEGALLMSDHFEQIPLKILMLCYDRDCKEFRPQNMELILVKDLFPALLSVEEKTKHWVHLFSLFTSLHLKAFNSILSQKRRLQNEMQTYLAMRRKGKGTSVEDKQNTCSALFKKMSASFSDSSKAEECFHKLNDMKDNNIFNMLALLLNDLQNLSSETTRDKLLNVVGDKHQNFAFLQTLTLKCSYNIFSSEHVRCILDNLSSDDFGNEHLKDFSIRLLLAVTSIFPMLLRGSEEQFQMLLERSNTVSDKMIEVLAKAGPHITVKISEIYPFLKRLCLEGTRLQSKYAVLALAALIDTSKQFIFSDLFKELVYSLRSGRNIPTVLQSLGCLSQHSVSAFEAHDGDITPFVYEKILQVDLSDDSSSYEENLGSTDSGKLKIYGMKTLVKSFLPTHGANIKRKISKLLDVLLTMMKNHGFCDNADLCDNKACVRLAAAKSVLRLSRRWDLHISPEVFCCTISLAKDESTFVKRSFVDKTRKLLKDHAIPIRYACAYALASSDCLKNLQDNSITYLAEFVKEYSKEARIRQADAVQKGLNTEFPAYIVVFLVHLLSHDEDFPLNDCKSEQLYAQFCSPLFFVLQALLNASNVDGDLDGVKVNVLYLLCMFRAIKRAEDAVDVEKTPKLHLLADIGFSYVTAINRSGISSSHAPGNILLPSSLYRENSRCLTQSGFDENFVKRIVQVFKSHISLNDSSLSKPSQNYPEDSTRLYTIEDSTSNEAPHKIVDLCVVKTAETQKTGGRGNTAGSRRKRAVSPKAPVSVSLHGCSKVDRHTGASDQSTLSLEKEQVLSSTGSVPVAESHILTKNVKRSSALKESGGVNSSSSAEHSEFDKGKLNAPCSLKESKSRGEALVGTRIELLSPIDSRFYSGTMDGYDSKNNKHVIKCDSGVVEQVCLDSGSWETISDGSPLERKVTLAAHSNVSDLPQRGRNKAIDTLSNNVAQKSLSLSNKENDKKKRLRKAYVDASVSKVTDMDENPVARRTRSRKV